MLNSQKGNIFALLFAAVGLTGVLGVVGMQTVSGPVRTITKVTQKNITDTDVITNGRILILNATVRPENINTDPGYDGDPEFEAEPQNTTCVGTPTGGGCLPTTIGTVLTDPWGTNYGYCAWNHGVVRTGVADTLDGRTDSDGYVIAVISAGPNKTFDTSCAAYNDNATRSLDTGGISPEVGSAMRVGTTDDIAKAWSYAEAKANSGGLWSEVGASGAAIERDLTIGAAGPSQVSITQSGAGTFLGLSTNILSMNDNDFVAVDGGLRIDDESEVANGECGATGTAGILRWNTAGNLEVCDGSAFVNVAIAGGEPARIRDADGNTQIQVEESANEDIIRFDTGGTERVTIDASGVVDIVGNATIGGTLGVTGAATVGSLDAGSGAIQTTGTLSSGAATVTSLDAGSGTIVTTGAVNGGSATVTGTTTTEDLTVNGDVILGDSLADDTVMIAGNTTVGGTLGVTGATTLSSTATVTGTLTANGDVNLGSDNSDLVDVQGMLKISDGGTCGGSDAGKLEYDTGGAIIRYCDGASGWQEISGAVDAVVDIGDVLATADDTTGNVLQWNGTNWIGTPASGLSAATSDESGKIIDDDSDTQVQVEEGTDDDTIRFDTAGTERMVIDDSGNVGIGNVTPVDAIDISLSQGEGLRILDEGDSNNLRIRLGTQSGFGNGNIQVYNAAESLMFSVDNARAIINNTEGLQLGTTSIPDPYPSAYFSVDSTTKGILPPRMTTTQRTTDMITNYTAAGIADGLVVYDTDLDELFVYDNDDTIWRALGGSGGSAGSLTDADGDTLVQVEEGADDDTIRFDTDGSERMVIAPAGNVGIGTATPAQPLDVVGNIQTSESLLLGLTAGDAPIYVEPTVTAGSIGTNIIDWDKIVNAMTLDSTTTIDMNTNSADLNFDGGTLFIDDDGQVGIGTVTPVASAILDIFSTDKGVLFPRLTTLERDAMDDAYGAGEEGMTVYNETDDTYQFWDGAAWQSFATLAGSSTELIDGATNDDDTWVRVAADDGTDNDTIRFAAGGSVEHMRISSTGNVGIGTATPASELDVAGDIGVSNYVKFGGVAGDAPTYVTPTVTAGSISTNIIDWDKIVNAMTLDATTTIDMNTNSADLNFDSGTLFIDDDGQVGVGTVGPDVSAIVDITSTDKGFLPPRMTTTERDAINSGTFATGLTIYNTTTGTLQYYDGTAWQNASAAGGLDIDDLSDAFHDTTTNFDGDGDNDDDNLAIGHLFATLDGTNPGARNTAIGATALDAVTTGDDNVAIGFDAAANLTSGSANITLGGNAMSDATTASSNIAIGGVAFSEYNGIESIAIGIGAGQFLSTGNQNTFLGINSGTQIDDGDANTFIGYQAGAATSPAVKANINSNVMLGWRAGHTIDSNAERNIAIGREAGAVSAGNGIGSGTDNILIGFQADVSANDASFELNIGNTIFGDMTNAASDGTGTALIGINNNAPDVALDVTGDIEYSGTITDVSDRRLKTDIHELSSDDLITKLSKIKTYEFKMKGDDNARIEYGVMAQELEELFPTLVHTAKDDMGTKSVNYMGLIAPMIEVSKSLKDENDTLKAEIASLKSDTDIIKAQIQTLNKGALGTVRGASLSSIMMIIFGFIGGGLFALAIFKRPIRKT